MGQVIDSVNNFAANNQHIAVMFCYYFSIVFDAIFILTLLLPAAAIISENHTSCSAQF